MGYRTESAGDEKRDGAPSRFSLSRSVRRDLDVAHVHGRADRLQVEVVDPWLVDAEGDAMYEWDHGGLLNQKNLGLGVLLMRSAGLVLPIALPTRSSNCGKFQCFGSDRMCAEVLIEPVRASAKSNPMTSVDPEWSRFARGAPVAVGIVVDRIELDLDARFCCQPACQILDHGCIELVVDERQFSSTGGRVDARRGEQLLGLVDALAESGGGL